MWYVFFSSLFGLIFSIAIISATAMLGGFEEMSTVSAYLYRTCLVVVGYMIGALLTMLIATRRGRG